MIPTPANDNTLRPASFDQRLLAHETYIRSRLYSLEKDATKHDDILQEVFSRALERWHLYRPDGNFAGWLYFIVYSVVHKRERSAAFGPTLPPTEPTQEYATDISLALERTPRAEEVLLSACGHSEADIARRFSVRAPTVHYRIKAARVALVAANDNHKRHNAAA